MGYNDLSADNLSILAILVGVIYLLPQVFDAIKEWVAKSKQPGSDNS